MTLFTTGFSTAGAGSLATILGPGFGLAGGGAAAGFAAAVGLAAAVGFDAAAALPARFGASFFAAFEVDPLRGVMACVLLVRRSMGTAGREGDLDKALHHARHEAVEPRRSIGRDGQDLRNVH